MWSAAKSQHTIYVFSIFVFKVLSDSSCLSHNFLHIENTSGYIKSFLSLMFFRSTFLSLINLISLQFCKVHSAFCTIPHNFVVALVTVKFC